MRFRVPAPSRRRGGVRCAGLRHWCCGPWVGMWLKREGRFWSWDNYGSFECGVEVELCQARLGTLAYRLRCTYLPLVCPLALLGQSEMLGSLTGLFDVFFYRVNVSLWPWNERR